MIRVVVVAASRARARRTNMNNAEEINTNTKPIENSRNTCFFNTNPVCTLPSDKALEKETKKSFCIIL